MLIAIPKSWLSWKFTIFDDNVPVANLDLAWFGESGQLLLNGVLYRLYREGFFSGAFILQKDGNVLARAVKPSALSRSFRVECNGEYVILEAEKILWRKFVLRQGDVVIGSISPEHAFTRKAIIDLPVTIDLPVRIFLVWLTIIIWKRSSDAGGTAAVVAASG